MQMDQPATVDASKLSSRAAAAAALAKAGTATPAAAARTETRRFAGKDVQVEAVLAIPYCMKPYFSAPASSFCLLNSLVL